MNPWSGLKGLPRGMWVLALSTLVNRLGTMVVFFLALYLVQGRGWTEAQAASALACMTCRGRGWVPRKSV